MWILALVLGVVGIVLNILLAWPQVWRAAQHGTEGISAGTVLTGFFARSLWSAYAVRIHDATLFVGQAPVALGFAAIAVFVTRGVRSPTTRSPGAQTAWALWIGITAGLLIAVLLAIVAPTVLTVCAVVSAAAVNLPQMLKVLRSPSHAAGVSAAMYWFTAAASACWLVYGFAAGHVAIACPHFVLLPTGVVTALAVMRHHRR